MRIKLNKKTEDQAQLPGYSRHQLSLLLCVTSPVPICKCHKRRYYVCCILIGGKELQHQSKRASEHCQNNNRDADAGFYLLNIYYALGIALSIHYQYNTSTCPIIGTVIEVPKVTGSFLTLNYNHRSYPTRPYPCPSWD